MRTTTESNLLPGFSDARWRTWSARPNLEPELGLVEAPGEVRARIDSAGDRRRYGGYRCTVSGIAGGATYAFEVEYVPRGIEDEQVSLYALLTWSTPQGRLLTREYADGIRFLEGDRRAIHRTVEAPREAGGLECDLVLRWTAGGSVEWARPRLLPAEPKKHDVIRVATTYLVQRRDHAANLAAMLAVLDRAGQAGVDVIVLSENFIDRVEMRPEPIPGPLTGVVAEKARRYRSYVVLSLNEREGEHFYKSAVLINREGAIVGRYRKTHLPLCEAETGSIPGDSFPVFPTDFGAVGIMICWDQCYPEAARLLRLHGARVIFVPTIGDAPLQSMARAADNAIPVVVAGGDGPRPSRIIDAEGSIVADLSCERDDVCIRELDLDETRLHRWLSVGDADGDPRNLYMKERRPDLYRHIAFDGKRQRY